MATPFELIEVTYGLLSSPDRVIMKAQCLDLFPPYVQEYIRDKSPVKCVVPEEKLNRITVLSDSGVAAFNNDYFEYISKLEYLKLFLSNVPLPGEDTPCYPLIAKHKGGYVVVAPLEVYA